MLVLEVKLSGKNSEKLSELARQTGKTPEELANDAVEHFAVELDADEHRKFIAWPEAAKSLAGIWKIVMICLPSRNYAARGIAVLDRRSKGGQNLSY